MTKILNQIAGLEEQPIPSLQKLYINLFEKEPPVCRRNYLIRRIAHRLQELEFGGLSPDLKKELKRHKENVDQQKTMSTNKGLIVGTHLIRTYKEVDHLVKVISKGFEYDRRIFRSLSAVAREITGTQWNGWKFFDPHGKYRNTEIRHAG
ncbi:MAG: DUF2924 domain-containing protein [Alphaproteobacteria bacterium]